MQSGYIVNQFYILKFEASILIAIFFVILGQYNIFTND